MKQDFYKTLFFAMMLAVGFNHHSNVQLNGICHHCDKLLCWILIVGSLILNFYIYHDNYYYIFLLFVAIAYILTFYCDYKENHKRNWNNICNLIPHMIMHLSAGFGLSNMLLKK